MLDEHLFVEALALAALFSEAGESAAVAVEEEAAASPDVQDEDCAYEIEDTSETTSVEKVLRFIERLANSDGIYKRLKQGGDIAESIKCNLRDKKDILDPFRSKYSWFFRVRTDAIRKKGFEDVMDMSSIMYSSSSSVIFD